MPAEEGKSLSIAVTSSSHNEGTILSPDGKKVAFTRTQGRNFDIWVMDVKIKKIKRDLQKLTGL